MLASYLEAAADQADGPAFIIHAGDHVGASPPNSALLQDEPSVGVLNTLANKWCIPFKLQRKLPDFLEPYAQARCNVVGTLGNHEFDEGAIGAAAPADGRQSSRTARSSRSAGKARAFRMCPRTC